MMQITYQKENGYIFKRLRSTTLPYKIGDITSMGWKVLNIEYQYKNKYYPEYKYHLLIEKRRKIASKKKEQVDLFMNEFKTFTYCFIAVLVINLLKLMLGI